jgi:hypothetical protein
MLQKSLPNYLGLYTFALITPWDVLRILQRGAYIVALAIFYNSMRFNCRDITLKQSNKYKSKHKVIFL